MNNVYLSAKMTTPLFNTGIEFEDDADVMEDITLHIRCQQRNGRKCITIIENIPDEYDLKKLVKAMRKLYACNGAVTRDKETENEVIILQGDNRASVAEFFEKVGLVKKENIKIH